MENKNQPINQNPDNNNQGANPASSSGNNPTINLDELTKKEAYFIYQKLIKEIHETEQKREEFAEQENYVLAKIEFQKLKKLFAKKSALNQK